MLCFTVSHYVAGVVACAAARPTCQGFTVKLGCVGGPVVVVFNGLLLEQGGEVGDLVGNSIGGRRTALMMSELNLLVIASVALQTKNYRCSPLHSSVEGYYIGGPGSCNPPSHFLTTPLHFGYPPLPYPYTSVR